MQPGVAVQTVDPVLDSAPRTAPDLGDSHELSCAEKRLRSFMFIIHTVAIIDDLFSTILPVSEANVGVLLSS